MQLIRLIATEWNCKLWNEKKVVFLIIEVFLNSISGVKLKQECYNIPNKCNKAYDYCLKARIEQKPTPNVTPLQSKWVIVASLCLFFSRNSNRQKLCKRNSKA